MIVMELTIVATSKSIAALKTGQSDSLQKQ